MIIISLVNIHHITVTNFFVCVMRTLSIFLFLSYRWHTILYWFQVYNIVMRHLYDSQSDHPNKSSARLTPYIVITILLAIFLTLYFTFLSLFCNYQFVLLNTCPLFINSPIPSHLVIIRMFLHLSLFLFVCFVL